MSYSGNEGVLTRFGVSNPSMLADLSVPPRPPHVITAAVVGLGWSQATRIPGHKHPFLTMLQDPKIPSLMFVVFLLG